MSARSSWEPAGQAKGVAVGDAEEVGAEDPESGVGAAVVGEGVQTGAAGGQSPKGPKILL